MAAKRQQVWAIGFRNYVEIRACTRAPKAIRTVCERDTIRRVGEVYEDRRGMCRLRYKKVPSKLTLVHTMHVGGKVLRSMHAASFWRKIHRTILPGVAAKLTAAQATKVLRP